MGVRASVRPDAVVEIPVRAAILYNGVLQVARIGGPGQGAVHWQLVALQAAAARTSSWTG